MPGIDPHDSNGYANVLADVGVPETMLPLLAVAERFAETMKSPVGRIMVCRQVLVQGHRRVFNEDSPSGLAVKLWEGSGLNLEGFAAGLNAGLDPACAFLAGLAGMTEPDFFEDQPFDPEAAFALAQLRGDEMTKSVLDGNTGTTFLP